MTQWQPVRRYSHRYVVSTTIHKKTEQSSSYFLNRGIHAAAACPADQRSVNVLHRLEERSMLGVIICWKAKQLWAKGITEHMHTASCTQSCQTSFEIAHGRPASPHPSTSRSDRSLACKWKIPTCSCPGVMKPNLVWFLQKAAGVSGHRASVFFMLARHLIPCSRGSFSGYATCSSCGNWSIFQLHKYPNARSGYVRAVFRIRGPAARFPDLMTSLMTLFGACHWADD